MEEKIIKYIKIFVIVGILIYVIINAYVSVKKGYNIDDLMDGYIGDTISNERVNELLQKIDVGNMIYYQNDTLNISDISMSDKLAIASKDVSFIELTNNNSHYGKYYYMLENDDLKEQYNLLFSDEYYECDFKNGDISWDYIDNNYYSLNYRSEVLNKISYSIYDKKIDGDKLNIEIIPYIENNGSIYDINNNLISEKKDDFDINNSKLDHFIFTFINDNGKIKLKSVNKIK